MTPYTSSFFALPVKRASGEELTYEQVVNKLDEETVSYDIGFGTGSGGFPETLRVTIKVEPERYEVAVAWLKDLIYNSVFDKERSAFQHPYMRISQMLTLV